MHINARLNLLSMAYIYQEEVESDRRAEPAD
jgi:hypothetical protein